ncbi:hypothetical protein ACFLUU_08650 [Chloroflexota bacterium]
MTNDWWLKYQRAEKHMVDINQEAMRYAESHPYSFTRIRLPDSHQEIRGRFQITEQPNPMIAVMLGDFIHNLRSALDWVVVACSPKKLRYDASFPILFQDIFAKDRDGNYVVNDTPRRKRIEIILNGLHPKAKALIIDCQPYRQSVSVNINRDIIGIISRLENTDKHRKIITIGRGGRDFTTYLSVKGFPEPIKHHKVLATGSEFLKDDTEIPYIFPPGGFPIPGGSSIQPSEMDMHLKGTVKILVEIPSRDGSDKSSDFYLIEDIMENALFNVREIINMLEFFVTSE